VRTEIPSISTILNLNLSNNDKVSIIGNVPIYAAIKEPARRTSEQAPLLSEAMRAEIGRS